MKNFNVYDPMKKGQGLVLDGQTLAHIEVLLNNEGTEGGSLLTLLSRCITPFGSLYRRSLTVKLLIISLQRETPVPNMVMHAASRNFTD